MSWKRLLFVTALHVCAICTVAQTVNTIINQVLTSYDPLTRPGIGMPCVACVVSLELLNLVNIGAGKAVADRCLVCITCHKQRSWMASQQAWWLARMLSKCSSGMLSVVLFLLPCCLLFFPGPNTSVSFVFFCLFCAIRVQSLFNINAKDNTFDVNLFVREWWTDYRLQYNASLLRGEVGTVCLYHARR